MLLVVLMLATGSYVGFRVLTSDQDQQDAAPPAAGSQATPDPAGTGPSPVEPTAAPVESVPQPAVVDTFPLGREPEGVAVSPDNKTVYVADQNSKDVHFVNAATGTASAVRVPNTPRFLAVSQDGGRLYVSLFENDFTGNGLAVIDTASRKLVKTIRTGPRPFEPAVDAAGRIWVPIHNAGRVEIYDPETLTEDGRITVPPNPHWVVFSPDGRTAYTANHESSQISVIGAEDRLVKRNIKVGRSPHALAVTPDGKQLIVTNYDVDTVEIYDTSDMRQLHKIKVGREPQAVMISTDGVHAYVVNEGTDNMSVVDLKDGKVVSTVGVGDSPRVVAISPDGLRLYVSDGRGQSITVLRTSKE
ncbi:YncE family protein [Actinoplanes rectilineatus]|uniref:YncE family protein n=1 Tax=Actinoplanes rectilineatus TaxID=113571 RepID=UPI0006963D68|nr:YncE family protein [Actinoplanes rectilineatus]